jgi:hypothetical protein
MQLTEDLKKELKRLHSETPDNIHGVSLGYKYKNGLKTNVIGIVFNVDRKIPETDLSSDQILPKIIKVGGQEYITDVKETARAELISCFCNSTDANTNPCPTVQDITRLAPWPNGGSALLPMRGGQEIVQYPTEWVASGNSYYASLGTLGFFCVDNIDNKIVGVTNSHVACYRRKFASARDWTIENSDAYNTFEPRNWILDNKNHNPGAITLINSGSSVRVVCPFIKRYQPVAPNMYNYSDVALLVMDPGAISSSASYKVWQPIGTTDYTGFLTFATTSEIDNLLNTNPRLYSTGRTTGPKGYSDTATCRLRVKSVGNFWSVGGTQEETDIMQWGDLIEYGYEDGSNGAVLGGDSGSALLADISGVRKIIGLVFAGNGNIGLASRIDRVASEMNIRAWDGTYNTALPTTSSGAFAGSAVVTDPHNILAGQTSIVYNGKTYYQAGFTKTTGLTQIN